MSSAMSDPKYLIKRAKYPNRPGRCKHCQEDFVEGTLRLGWKETPGALKGSGPWSWAHLDCVPEKRWRSAVALFGNVDEIPGVNDDAITVKLINAARVGAQAVEKEELFEKELKDISKAAMASGYARSSAHSSAFDYKVCEYVINDSPTSKKRCDHCDEDFVDLSRSLRLGWKEKPEEIKSGEWKWAHAACVPMVRWDNAADVYGTLDPNAPDVPGNLHAIPGVDGCEATAEEIREWYAVSAVSVRARAKAWESEALATLGEEKKLREEKEEKKRATETRAASLSAA